MNATPSVLEGARLAIGAGDLLLPGAAAPGVPFPDALYRVLGVRQVAQALMTGRLVGHRTSGGVDVLHAASMLVIAAVSSRFRAAALAQAGLATVFAASEAAFGRRS